ATLTGNILNNHISGHNNVETIYGLDGNDTLYGKGGDDTLYGGNGNDILDGGTGNDTLYGEVGSDTLHGHAGSDKTSGGRGNDTYVVDNAGDAVTENSGEGSDLVQASISYTLGANVENLTLTGSSAIDGTGNALDNIITGNSANNVLFGGAGADTLTGGAGNDTFVYTDISDSLVGSADLITDFTSTSGAGASAIRRPIMA